MSRRALIAGAVTLVLGLLALAGLALAGTGTIPVRTYALGVPDTIPVADVPPHHDVCEGNITSPSRFDQIGLFGTSIVVPSRISVTVAPDGGGRQPAHGTFTLPARPLAFFVPLAPATPGGVPVRVCVHSLSHRGFELLGSPSVQAGTAIRGRPGHLAFSLVLRRRSGQTFLGSLPLAFSRASLWRLQWVGPWTYWALLGLLLAAVPVAALTVARAAGEDEEPAEAPPGEER